MNILFDVPPLQEALGKVTRALGARSANPALECVLLEADETRVTLTCSDGEITICCGLSAQVKAEGSVLLPARLFHEIVRKLPCDQMKLTVQGNQATLGYMDSVTKLGCFPSSDYPEVLQIAPIMTLDIRAETLRDIIGKTAFAASSDPSRKILTGCLIEAHRHLTRFVALDGYRLAIAEAVMENPPTENGKPLNTVFPSRVLLEIGRMLPADDQPVDILLGATRAMVRFADTTVYTSLMVGEFINYEQILPKEDSTRVSVNRTLFMDAITRASIVAREGVNNVLRLSFEAPPEDGGSCMMVITANTERASVHEEILVHMFGVSMSIAFNADYLIEIMKILPDEMLWLRFNSNVSPCVIAPNVGEQFMYLVLPVRTFS